jgi:titin
LESSDTIFNDTLVKVGSTYLYYVTAINTKGESQPSNTVEAIPQAPPSPPQNIQVSEGNGYNALSWETPSFLGGLDLAGYKVYRQDPANGLQMITEIDQSSTLYKDKDLTNGRTYTYYISAYNDYGESDLSAPVQGTPATVPSPPVEIALEENDGEIVITWGEPSDNGGSSVLDYMIKRKVNGGSFEEIGTVPFGTNTYSDTDVETGEVYVYVIDARNRMGASKDSEEGQAMALGPPALPIDIVVTAGDGQVDLTWSAPLMNGGREITGYTILRADPEFDNPVVVAQLEALETSYVDDKVENGVEYTYKVTALNEIGESNSDWSGVVQPLGLPEAPKGLSTEVQDSGILIKWSAPDDDGGCCIQVYRIFRTSEDGETEQIGVVEGTVFEFTDKDDKDPGTYTYKVVAVNSVGQGESSSDGDVNVKSEDEGSFVGDNIGLLITIPIIVLLLALLILVLVKKSGNGNGLEAVPQPSPVMDQPDPNGYLNENQEQALDPNSAYDQLYPAENTIEQ